MVPYYKNHNRTTSLNPSPGTKIYAHLSPHDAPYSISELPLRSAIFLPSTFCFGRNGKIPVLLVPGTGSMGGEIYSSNFAKLLRKGKFGDPCWLNVPGRMCDDASKNAEFVAYAILYLSSLCGTKIAIVAWSQGTLSSQWALKFWPSTRNRVRNLVCLSGLFKGTITASLLAPKDGVGKAAPAIWQQKRGSKFTRKLAENGGDSAYVPTTNVYSRWDEIVQPQFGMKASARLKDERGVGVLNCEIQSAVGKNPASFVNTHFSMLNPLAWALTEDAIMHGDEGCLNRIDMARVSSHMKPLGLNALDVGKTRALAAICARAVVTFEGKCKQEPDLPEYCRKGVQDKRCVEEECVDFWGGSHGL